MYVAVLLEVTLQLHCTPKIKLKRKKVKDVVLLNASLAAYWPAKEEIANHKIFFLGQPVKNHWPRKLEVL